MNIKNKKTIRLTIDVSPEINEALNSMARESSSTKSDILRKSIALFRIAITEKNKGNTLAIFDEKGKILREIIGI